ncbi:50S ribosomal protein L11 [Patescibacteria group bacterium]|nr:50S ribosomal protein L11 [Patescibacteria group bacterium]
MAKEAIKKIKLQVVGGKATAAPPLGPALGQAGINIGEFVNQFNAATKDRMGEIVPVIISLFEDRSFTFVMKTSPASRMILEAIGQKKGSGKNVVKKAGTLTKAQVREIALAKLEDLSANDVDQAMKIIEGTARSMGVEVK